MAAAARLNLKKARHGKCHNEKLELPFIVRELISGFIIQCKPLQGKENEWTHLQTCHWLAKCQIHPNLSCLDEWQALGRESLHLLSFHSKKKSQERRSLPQWSQSCCFIRRKTGLSEVCDKVVVVFSYVSLAWHCARSPREVPLRVVYASICQCFPYVRFFFSSFAIFARTEWSSALQTYANAHIFVQFFF